MIFFFKGWLNQWYKWLVLNLAHILPEYGFWTLNAAALLCSEEDLLSLCVNTQELVLKTFPQRYERGCKREACGNMVWRNRWLTHPLEHVHQCAALTNWTHRLIPTPWHFVRNWAAECCLNHTDMMRFQNSIHSLRGVLCDAWLCVSFHCRSVVISVLQMMFYCGYFSKLTQ